MQPNNTPGKNASDIGLIIDAMDILYTGDVQGFCLVSSDGDFNKLATRLREAGKFVIGMGEKKTPESFRASCERFIFLDIIESEDPTARRRSESYSESASGKSASGTNTAARRKRAAVSEPAQLNVMVMIRTCLIIVSREVGMLLILQTLGKPVRVLVLVFLMQQVFQMVIRFLRKLDRIILFLED